MRSKLLSTAAILTLSLSGAMAVAQDRGSNAAGGEKGPAAERSHTSPSHSAEPKSSAQTGAESSKSPAAERSGASHAGSESRSGEPHQRSESKTKEGKSETRSTESKPSEQRGSESRTGEATRPTDTRSSEHKSDQRTGDTRSEQRSGEHKSGERTGDSKPSISEKTNAASEPKQTPGVQRMGEPTRSNAESTQHNEQNRTAAPTGTSSTTNAGKSSEHPGSTAANPPAANPETNQTGAAGSNNRSTGTAATSPGSSGAQTNANSGTNLEPQQQSRIVDTLRSHRSEATTNMNFSVNVGATVPESVHHRPLPEDIITIAPQYRGYDYVMVRDEVVIIEPRTRKVVTVIREGSGSSGASARHSSLTIPVEKRRRIHTEVIRSYHGPRDVHFALRVGERVPENITLERFPEAIYTEEPELKSYEYVVVQEQVALVDPQSREIVQVID